ncbi:MAG: hypothetical protein J6B12_02340 [Clostridia bacterium]|nr:hypothetical protein [Clostridia bacterium]
MEEKFNQIKYQNEFNKQKYDRISFLVPKGEKEAIKSAADREGKSVNSYILEAVHKQMERGE